MKYTIITGALMLAGYVTAGPIILSQSVEHVSPMYTTAGDDTLGSYIVVLKDNLPPTKLAEHNSWVGELASKSSPFTQWLHPSTSSSGVRHVYNMSALKGYSGKFDEDAIDKIRASKDVAYVEPDSMVYTNAIQVGAPWGLARVSHRPRLTFGTFNRYVYDSDGGEGVNVYVLDTGINVEHNDFEGRAQWGTTVLQGDQDEDANGHGTHCAGTIAGRKYGIARKATLSAVKVLRSDGAGLVSDVLAGVEWTINSHKRNKGSKGAVANMSFGGTKSQALETAVNGAFDEGVIFTVAAGNENEDACNYSPASSHNAITVGASALNDNRAFFSNYGKCIDIFAPGVNIVSDYIGSTDAIATLSGTSMASSHVAGLAAYFLSLEISGNLTPKQIKDKILKVATPDKLNDLPTGTVNLLAFNGYTE